MDDLRLILLLIGAGVILGVYAWTRLQSRGSRGARSKPVASPAAPHAFDEDPDDEAVQRELQRLQTALGGGDAAADSQPANGNAESNELIVISVVAEADKPFTGDALAKAFANNDLRFGERSIFHRMLHEGGEHLSVYGITNMLKPGDFGSGDLTGFETPGITLFLQLPGPQATLAAFDDFVQTAERLAVELGGQLMDHNHCVITHQALMAKRERLAHAHRQPQVAS